MNDILLEVKNLKTHFKTFRGTVKAVDGVSFTLDRGEILGVVGESGGGKSITGFSILKLIDNPGEIVGGAIIFNGEDLMKKNEKEMQKIRGNDISMIFQDPMTSLNPLYTIGKQIEEVLILHTNLSPKERNKRCIELLDSVGIPNAESRLKNYPHEFSGGMRQRVIIAIALASEPQLIIADEPTTALDVTIQAQILDLLKEIVEKRKCSLILITHDMAVVSQMADKINVMYCGEVVESGSAETIINSPKHPYTKGLLESIPRFSINQDRLKVIDGVVPNMFDLPKGCNFSSRCKHVKEECSRVAPPIINIGKNHNIICHSPIEEGE